VPLSLSTRGVGDVTIVRCSGRIVGGGETESLRDHISGLLQDRKAFVLHLGEVAFIDSSGFGMLVRLLTSTRRASGDLKLCNVPADVYKVLKMTNLITLFEAHESEEDAVSAFYRRSTISERVAVMGPAYCAWINPPMCSLTCGNCCGVRGTGSSPTVTCTIH